MNRNFGIGVDIENIERFNNIVYKEKKSFLNKIFTDEEMSYCFAKTNPAPHLAARFAGKEAVVKAISSTVGNILNYNDIEIINNKEGTPKVMIKKKGFEDLCFEISLSHNKDFAIAFTILKRGEIKKYEKN